MRHGSFVALVCMSSAARQAGTSTALGLALHYRKLYCHSIGAQPKIMMQDVKRASSAPHHADMLRTHCTAWRNRIRLAPVLSDGPSATTCSIHARLPIARFSSPHTATVNTPERTTADTLSHCRPIGGVKEHPCTQLSKITLETDGGCKAAAHLHNPHPCNYRLPRKLLYMFMLHKVCPCTRDGRTWPKRVCVYVHFRTRCKSNQAGERMYKL